MTNTLTHPVGERLRPQKKQWDPPKWMYPILYNKGKILAAILAIFMLFSLFSFGFAIEPEYGNFNLGTGLDTMIKGIFASDGGLAEWVIVDDNLELMKFKSDANRVDIHAQYVTPIYNVFASVGLVIALMFWGMGYLDMVINANGQQFLESIVRKFVLLIIGIVVVTNAKTIVCGVLDIVNAIYTAAMGGAAVGQQDYAIANAIGRLIKKELNEAKTFLGMLGVSLGYVVQFLLPWAISIVAGLGVKVFALARYLEICIVAAVSPVMFSDISNSHGGFTHSASFRAIKHVIALALQGVVILVGLKLCSAVSASIIGSTDVTNSANFLDIGFGMVAVGLAQLGITAKSQQIARQLIGLG